MSRAGGTKAYDELNARLGLTLDGALLERALTHRSYAYENGGLPTNERLEFLGDAVLGLVITDSLFRDHPDLSEGQLAKLRAAVVNMRALADVARGLELGRYIRLGRGEEATGGRDKSSILGDAVEAVIGAVYLAGGFPLAGDFIRRLFDPVLEASSRLGAGLDWKTSLQELTARGSLGVPEYVVDEEGPDHEKLFTAHVMVGGTDHGIGTGRSKKEAEQRAAEAAWNAIRGFLDLGAETPEPASEADSESDSESAGTAETAKTSESDSESAGTAETAKTSGSADASHAGNGSAEDAGAVANS